MYVFMIERKVHDELDHHVWGRAFTSLDGALNSVKQEVVNMGLEPVSFEYDEQAETWTMDNEDAGMLYTIRELLVEVY